MTKTLTPLLLAAILLWPAFETPVRAATDSSPFSAPETNAGGLKAGERRTISIKGLAVALRWCPPGKFTMGSPESEPERAKDETLHEVTLTKGFWMMETDVTQELWTSLDEKNQAKFKGPQQPAATVLWYDAVEFCNRLSAATGLKPAYKIHKDAKDPSNKVEDKNDPMKWTVFMIPDANGFRLPTEAQWEYACRAGTTTAFAWGDTVTTDQANYNGTNAYNNGPNGAYLKTTTPVGKYPPNPWGFLDIEGNVWQWCWDWYGPYPHGGVTDPAGATSGNARILRGGVWHYKPAYVRSANRYKDRPAKPWDLLGLRAIVPVLPASAK
jgi:formylglycine-generating enzyme required for sulfatase activity